NTNQLIDDVFIEVTVPQTGETFGEEEVLYGEYIPNSISGKYVVILPPGNYNMRISVEGFKEVVEGVTIFDKSDYRTYIEQDLVLKPKNLLEKLPQMKSD
ncbi:MAG: PEGA domain-containing protein, partial [Vicingaceae bacterium]